MRITLIVHAALIISTIVVTSTQRSLASDKGSLLNVSYDPTRELYQDFNAALVRYWK